MSATPDVLDRYGWWTSLNHGGLLVSPSKLAEFFPAELPPLDPSLADRLRRDLTRLHEGGDGTQTKFLDTVLEDVLGLHASRWIKGSQIDKSWSRAAVTKEIIRPRRIWLGPGESVLPVFVADASLGAKGEAFARLGVGRGRRAVSRVVEWLRKANQKLALLVGGRHIRLIHAGSDYDAFCEWDTALWFAEGLPGPQVTALRVLLGKTTLDPLAEGKPSRLLTAIQATRQGQAELSAQLGERVRQAVETLIHASAPALEAIDCPGPMQVSKRDMYIAATRLVMRAVVVLFAEARQDDLLPRNNPIYEASYGLSSLREQLDRLAGGRGAERLRHSYSAWPRLLALFDLLFHGSGHEKIPVTRYGGGLFFPGDPNSRDGVLRALAAFEQPDNAPTDAAVHRILELLTRSPVKVRQGKMTRWVEAPVDFSDLSSEYIGILYEGLLDFELRRAPQDDAMVFLNVGDEPVLSISRLDRMTNDELAQLLEKLSKGANKSAPEEEDADEDTDEENADDDSEVAEEAVAADAASVAIDPDVDDMRTVREKIQLWAERAVKAAKLVKYPRNDKDPRVRDAFAQEVTAKARALIKKPVMPGAWYLVRWGGTRKGSGTFYTRPQLAGPTVRRALEPLAYVPVHETKDDATGLVRVTEWAPKKPSEILSLKVCDPAMGSGSFLISALRYLTDALFESLHHHGRLEDAGDGVIPRLADGLPSDHPWNETLPVPKDHPDFDKTLRARLKRHVVERCIYGVDLDPLAVELAKTALWVETMDPKLPLGFFDHKLKCGNALVGCWFDRFQDYPILAWEREGGDAKHDRFVHHFREFVGAKGKDKGKTIRSGDKWTFAIKQHRDDVIKPELQRWLEQRFSKQVQFAFAIEGKTADVLHDEAMVVFERMHALPVHDAEGRERMYREEILGSGAITRLREALDTWCALWFWPGDEVEKAPGPMALLRPSDEAMEVVRRVRDDVRFFHWELEFPDVFARPGSGFDAMVGNPPWENLQPSPREFFSNTDPMFSFRGRLESLAWIKSAFEAAPTLEEGWIAYCARNNWISNWVKYVGDPFGLTPSDADGENIKTSPRLETEWKTALNSHRGYASSPHPFCLQVGRVFTYKLFLEIAARLIHENGALAQLIPSGIYTDSWSRSLRKLFLEEFEWRHLYAFQNERFVFEGIHHSFKMVVMHARKGSSTRTLFTRFRIGPGDSPEAHEVEHDLLDERGYLPLPAERIDRFSPSTGALVEVRNSQDLRVLSKLYDGGNLLGEHSDCGAISYTLEFMMNSGAERFPPKIHWDTKGYRPDIYGYWLKGAWKLRESLASDVVASYDGSHAISLDSIEDVAVPFYQGIMIQQFHPSAKAWISGTGLRARWGDIEYEKLAWGPQFLMGISSWTKSPDHSHGIKLGYREVARSTDSRTLIASLLPSMPCGHKVPVIRGSGAGNLIYSVAAIANSFACDWIVRQKLGATAVAWFFLREIPMPLPTSRPELTTVAGQLNLTHIRFAPQWLSLLPPESRTLPWRRLWAITPHERLRLRCILDAVVAKLYGLDAADFGWILRDCDHPVDKVCDKPFSRTLDPKGFWRVDKQQQPEVRHTVLSLVAFYELERLGLDAFLAQNDGEGWMLPETLRLADYGLGHDERAKNPQPVASALGPRFLPWQLEQGVEESWEECKKHAETIEKILGLTPAPDASPPGPSPAPTAPRRGGEEHVVNTEGQTLMFAPEPKELPPQMNLFGVEEKKPTGKKKGKRG